MSQYQYPPPSYPTAQPYYYGQYSDPRAPAKRASVLLLVLGGLALLFGGCSAMFAGSSMLDQTMSTPEGQQAGAMLARAGVSVKTYVAIVSGMMLFIGVVGVGLGVWVRGGRLGAVVTSIVFTSLGILMLALMMVSGAIESARMGGANVLGICVGVVPLGLLGLLLAWLVQAAKNASKVGAGDAHYQAQYQSQYWQYMQQNYPQGNAGMPAPPNFDSGAKDAPGKSVD